MNYIKKFGFYRALNTLLLGQINRLNKRKLLQIFTTPRKNILLAECIISRCQTWWCVK